MIQVTLSDSDSNNYRLIFPPLMLFHHQNALFQTSGKRTLNKHVFSPNNYMIFCVY